MQGLSALETDLRTDPAAAVPTDSVQAHSPTKTTSGIARGTSEVEPGNMLKVGPAFPLLIQYFCCEGLVVQTYLLNLGDGVVPRDKVEWGSPSRESNICIGVLDFVNDISEGSTNLTNFDRLKASDDRHKLLALQVVPHSGSYGDWRRGPVSRK